MKEWLNLPIDASAHGGQIDNMIGVIHWLMLLLFVGWGLYFIYVLVRFRKSKHPKADPVGVRSHLSSYVDVVVVIFEAVLLIGFSIPIWSQIVNAFPAEKDAVVVRVVGEQFVWNIHYPGADGVFGRTAIHLVTSDNPLGLDRDDPDAKDDIATINQLNLPVGKPVIIYLTTKDVIHSFSLPLFRVKQDLIPGQRIPIWFKPVKTTREIQEQLTAQIPLADGMMPPRLGTMVAMSDYNTKDGTVIVKKGDSFSEEMIPLLVQAGVTSVSAAPATPTEIACAQLCGLGHFRMRGFVTIQTEDEFKAWLDEQAAYLTQ
jgi:cytochrome c oxidase subunit II